jgi:hypothetical protein
MSVENSTEIHHLLYKVYCYCSQMNYSLLVIVTVLFKCKHKFETTTIYRIAGIFQVLWRWASEANIRALAWMNIELLGALCADHSGRDV